MELKEKKNTKKKKTKPNHYMQELLIKYGRGGLIEDPAPEPKYIDKRI